MATKITDLVRDAIVNAHNDLHHVELNKIDMEIIEEKVEEFAAEFNRLFLQ